MKTESDTIKVIIKPPGRIGRFERIPNTLEAFQHIVAGYIEAVTCLTQEGTWAVICNEEGRLYGMLENCELLGTDYVGTIAVVGVKGENFTDVPLSLAKFNSLCK